MRNYAQYPMLDGTRALPRSFYARDTLEVAADLIGKQLVRRLRNQLIIGRIVETEAYVGEDDPACHAFRGLTPRTAVMYGEPGRAYVYFTYGMYNMLNVVTMHEGFPAAVLIRALEPVAGERLMVKHRGLDEPSQWTSGPGKLCVALAIDLRLNRQDLCDSEGPLWIADGAAKRPLVWTPRIGINVGQEHLWRCIEAGNRFVSPSKFNPKKRA